MKIDSRDLTGTAVFAALYVVINVVQTITVGNPTIYGPIQLRVADFMIALAALFGWPIIGGVTIGCFLTNAYYFIGAPDVILGPIANLIAACFVLFLRKRRLPSMHYRRFAYWIHRGWLSLAVLSAARSLLHFTRVGWHDC